MAMAILIINIGCLYSSQGHKIHYVRIRTRLVCMRLALCCSLTPILIDVVTANRKKRKRKKKIHYKPTTYPY